MWLDACFRALEKSFNIIEEDRNGDRIGDGVLPLVHEASAVLIFDMHEHHAKHRAWETRKVELGVIVYQRAELSTALNFLYNGDAALITFLTWTNDDMKRCHIVKGKTPWCAACCGASGRSRERLGLVRLKSQGIEVRGGGCWFGAAGSGRILLGRE